MSSGLARDWDTNRATRQRHALPLAFAALLLCLLVISPPARASTADFGLQFQEQIVSSDQAGAHADFEGRFRLMLDPTREEGGQHFPWADLRNLAIYLPPGLVGGLGRFPQCSAAVLVEQLELEAGPEAPHCSVASQVGLISPGVAGVTSFPPGAYTVPLYNLEQPPGSRNVVARLGAIVLFTPMFIDIRLDPKRNDAITAELMNAPAPVGVTGANTTLWGSPADPSHDAERSDWLEGIACGGSCPRPVPYPGPALAVLSNPTSCGEASGGFEVKSYPDPSGGDAAFGSLDFTRCERVPFEPSLSLAPSTRVAGTAAGMNVSLTVPQEGLTNPTALRTGDLREATVTLPEGVTLDSSMVDGLGTCEESQIGYDPNERQVVDLGASGAGTNLVFEGQATAAMPALASAAEAQHALEGLANLGPGEVVVQGRRGGPWQVDFSGSLHGRDVPPITGTHSELQRLSIRGKGGTYRLGFGGESTAPLPYDAAAPEVQGALEALGALEPGDVEVSGEVTSGRSSFRIAFGGRLAGVDVPAISVAPSLTGFESFAAVSVLTEGGSPVKTETVEQGGSLRFDGRDPACPEASKLATGRLTTPLLQDPLSATVYLAQPDENPFGSRFGTYLVASGDGVRIKVGGQFAVDPRSGQLTLSFAEFPQLPIGQLELNFKGGNHGVLTTPPNCGTFRSTYELISWSGAVVEATSPFTVDERCERERSTIRFNAGSTHGVGGALTDLVVQLRRESGSPPVRRLEVSLPPGLVANLNGVVACPDSALAEAGRSGRDQPAPPSCPAASRIGTLTLGVGSGLPAYPQEGAVYLAGPYRGAPRSVVMSLPAVAGPFDLGDLIVRAAVTVDPATAALRAVSDPIPTLVQGVPLELRDLRVLIDRPGFMLNPTDCGETAVTGSIEEAPGASAPLSDRFQLGDCAGLSFSPRLRVSFRGEVGRNGHPTLHTVLKPRPGGANLSSLKLALPRGELLDQGHIRAVCGASALAKDACPPGAALGRAEVRSPLLAKPLTGPLLLTASSNRLPDLTADLKGEVDLVLHGHLGYSQGALRVSFPDLPDVPISTVTMNLAGGRRGLLVNTEGLCSRPGTAAVRMGGFNGRVLAMHPNLHVACPGGRARAAKQRELRR